MASEVFSFLLSSPRPMSAEALADKTGYDVRFVRAAADELIRRSFVSELHIQRKLKRNLVPLEIAFNDYGAIGVKIRPDRLIAVITNLKAEERDEALERELADTGEESVIRGVAGLVDELRTQHGGDERVPRNIIGLGVELGGHVNGLEGEVVFSPNLAWERVPLGRRLQDATGLPAVVVENDANALAIHEHLFGKGKGVRWFGVILMSQGVGCGLILDGQLAHGATGAAGEFGHIIVESGGRSRCWCGRDGCLETTASVRAIENAVPDASSFEDAVRLADNGDEVAQTAFERAGDMLGRGVSVLLNLVNLEKLVVAVPRSLFDAQKARQILEDSFDEVVKRQTFSTSGSDCERVLSFLPDAYGAHGAASAVVRRFASNPLQWEGVRPTSP